MTTLTATHARGAGFLAAQLLHQDGIASIHPANLYIKVHFGASIKGRSESLERAVATGWLALNLDGSIKLGAHAVKFFAGNVDEAPAYVGKVAGPRDTGSAYDRPALKYKPNSQGNRDDVPAFSIRSAPSFRSVPTGGGHQ